MDPLTQNGVTGLYNNDPKNFNPTVQVVSIKQMQNAAAPTRYRVVISDGTHFAQVALAQQLNDLVNDKILKLWCLVQVKQFMCNTVNQKRLIILLDVAVTDGGPGQQIGSPVNVDQVLGSQQQQQPPQQAPQHQPQQHQQSQQYHQVQQPVGQGQNQGQFQQMQGQRGRPQPSSNQPGAARPRPLPAQQPSNNSQFQQSNRFGAGGSGGGVASYMSSRGGMGMGGMGDMEQYQPIKALNPYQNRWTIKARVSAKGEVKPWTKGEREGKLLNIELIDNEGTQIKATMFNEAAENFYHVFEIGKVYSISKGSVRSANKRWSHLTNEYELTLNQDAEVAMLGDDAAIPKQVYNFVPIREIQHREKEEMLDVVGIVTSVSNIGPVKTKKGAEMQKRTLTLTDDTAAINVTIWNEDAVRFNEETLGGNPVLAIRTARVSDFGNRSLSSSFSSVVTLNPDHPVTGKLQSWWQGLGDNPLPENLTQMGMGQFVNATRKCFSAIKEENLGSNPDQPDVFKVRGTITFFRNVADKPPWYLACPDINCNKKVSQDENTGIYVCTSDKHSYAEVQPIPRYVLAFMACDDTGSTWISAFNETAKELLGNHPAEELNTWVTEGNIKSFDKVFSEATFKSYIFTLRAKTDKDPSNDEQRVKCQLVRVEPVDFKTESVTLLEQIGQLEAL